MERDDVPEEWGDFITGNPFDGSQSSCDHPQGFPPYSFCFSRQETEGAMIAVKKTVAFHQLFVEKDPWSHYIILDADINNHRLTIVNLYAPNVHQKRFVLDVLQKASKIR